MAERVALITGGAKGIGRGIALDLAAQQWSVAICYRTSDVEATATANAITSRGGRALSICCDVSDPQAAKGLVTQVEQQWGHIDALINSAGPYHRVNLFEETVEGWNQMFDGNLHPIFYLAKAVATGMKARKSGRIISFSMANADQMISQPDVTAHYIAKAGILILTRTLAKLLAPHGITVNAISPGFIDSGSAPPGELAGMTKRIPAGYIGTVDDTVAAVRYLLSDDARYVNGANIQISGAWGDLTDSLVVLLLAERARSEGARSTRAIEDQPGYPSETNRDRADGRMGTNTGAIPGKVKQASLEGSFGRMRIVRCAQ